MSKILENIKKDMDKKIKDEIDEIDTNKDGILQFNEIASYGLDKFNNYGIYLFFSLVGSILISMLFMVWIGTIEWGIFLLMCQCLAPGSLFGWVGKMIFEKYGLKTNKVMDDNKKLNIENNQIKIAMQLKKEFTRI